MKQTAVEWLYETLWKQNNYSLPSNILEQAKEMEKQQIIDSQEDGFTDGCRYTTGFEQTVWYDGEQYYNETYKNTKND